MRCGFHQSCPTITGLMLMLADPSHGKKARSAHPIIMISSSPTALITMWNVKKFLEQGVYVSASPSVSESMLTSRQVRAFRSRSSE